MPYASKVAIDNFINPINQTLDKYRINTPLRIAAFIAQIAHESGSLRYEKELASGDAYEGRKDLGNIHSGDGRKYKGRGLIEITGETNYELVSKALGQDFVNHPELLEQPIYAALSAGWFWDTHNLNHLADNSCFTIITKTINGGLNGLQEREQFYERAKAIIK